MNMKISLIVAMANNRTIGINNQLPWHLSADLKRFKQLTMGNPILMGRKTHESIGRPLPGRDNLIITHNVDYQAAGCLTFHNIADVLLHCHDKPELFVIGGSSLYNDLLPVADTLYVTTIDQDFVGDTFFPEILGTQWQEVERVTVANDTSVDFTYHFITLARLPTTD